MGSDLGDASAAARIEGGRRQQTVVAYPANPDRTDPRSVARKDLHQTGSTVELPDVIANGINGPDEGGQSSHTNGWRGSVPENAVLLVAARLERRLDRICESLDSARRELRAAQTDYSTLHTRALEIEGSQRNHAAISGLTRQEFRIAQMAAIGSSYGEIAAAAGVSKNTVKSHMKGIYSKLEIHTRWQLAQRMPTPMRELDYSNHLSNPIRVTAIDPVALNVAQLVPQDNGVRPSVDSPPRRVTVRQAQILNMITAGQADKEIARELGVSPRTVRTHLERLFKSHGFHDRAAAAAFWARLNA